MESRSPTDMTKSITGSTTSLNNSELRLGKMHLVDLAGSERVALSGAEGSTLVETQNINLSLTALGDVLQALSRNATILNQQGKSLRESKGPSALVPVPYRNSKLTHLLKDSLGGNSKTIMITTIRNLPEYYQQTLISLMYASRAKKVKNRSLINRNVIGDTGIIAVTTEIERLKSRLEERRVEFETLRNLQIQDAHEKSLLRSRLEELTKANEMEKKQLENQMSHIIHSQAGQLALQREKIVSLQTSLQDELLISQNRIVEQEREISLLKKELEENTRQPNKEQIEKMQGLLDSYQRQITISQQETLNVKRESESLKQQLSALQNQLAFTEKQMKTLEEKCREKQQENQTLSNSLANATNTLQHVSSDKNKFQSESSALHDKYRVLVSEFNAKTSSLENCQALVTSLEEQVSMQSSEIKQYQKQLKSLSDQSNDKIKGLERECNFLTEKLSTTLSSLEQKSSSTIDEVTRKFRESEDKLRVAQEQNRKYEDTIKNLEIRTQALQVSLKQSSENVEVTYQNLQKNYDTLKHEKSQQDEKIASLSSVRLKLEDELNLMKTTLAEERERQVIIKQELQVREQEYIQKLRDSNRREEELKNTYESKIELLSKSHRDDTAKLEKISHDQKEAYQSKLKVLEAKLREELEKAYKDADVSREEEFQRRLSSLRQEWQLDVQSKFEQSMLDLSNKHMFEKKELLRAQVIETERLNNLLIETKTKLHDEYERKLNSIRIELQSDYQQKRDEEIRNLKASFESQRQELIQSQLKELDSLKSSMVENKQAEHSYFEQRLQMLQSQLTLQYQQKLQDAQASADEEKSRLIKDYEGRLEGSRSSFSRDAKDLEAKYQDILKSQDAKWESTLNQARSDYEAKRVQMLQAHQTEMETMRRSFEDEKAMLERQYQERILSTRTSMEEEYSNRLRLREQELMTNYQNEVDALKLSLVNVKTKEQEIVKGVISKTKAHLEAKYREKLEEFSHAEKSSNEKFGALLQETERRLRQELRDTLEKQEKQHHENLLQCQSTHDSQVQALEDAIKVLRAQNSSLSRDKLSLQQQLDENSASLGQRYSEKEDELNKTRSEYEQQLLSAQHQYEKQLLAMETKLREDLRCQYEMDYREQCENLIHQFQYELEGSLASNVLVVGEPSLQALNFSDSRSILERLQEIWHKKLSEMSESSRQTFETERLLMVTQYEQAKESLLREITSWKAKYDELFNAYASKQKDDVVKQNELREEYQKSFSLSLESQERQYQMRLKSMEEAMKVEKLSFQKNFERLQREFDNNFLQLQLQHDEDMRKQQVVHQER